MQNTVSLEITWKGVMVRVESVMIYHLQGLQS